MTDETIDGERLHECEECGATWLHEDTHWSAADCNETGRGVTLCHRCYTALPTPGGER